MAAGRRGSCKLCESTLRDGINKLIEDGWNAKQVKEWTSPLGLTFDRQTFYAHKEHITAPIITAVEKARKDPAIKPKTNREFLEMIRDLGAARAIENPDEVTIDQALNAVKVMEGKREGRESIAVLLAKVVTRELPSNTESAEVVVGEFRELEATHG